MKTNKIILIIGIMMLVSGCSRPEPKEQVVYNYVTVAASDSSSTETSINKESNLNNAVSGNSVSNNTVSGNSDMSNVESSESSEDKMDFENIIREISEELGE